MTRVSAIILCMACLAGTPFAAAQSVDEPATTPLAPSPQADPSYQAPRPGFQPLRENLSRSQIYQNRKIQEAVGTPYGTVNGKVYRPQPDDYYTRSRVLHPQVVRGWGYDPNAANYGPDYNAGVLPSGYPVPQTGSNVTFRLFGYGHAWPYGADATRVYARGIIDSGGGLRYAGAGVGTFGFPGTPACLHHDRGVPVFAGEPGMYHGGGTYSYFNERWYLADSNYPNAANRAIVPVGADPYNFHFGAGLHRSGVSGHYRFPYYSYRRPWYYPGDASFQRNTQFPW